MTALKSGWYPSFEDGKLHLNFVSFFASFNLFLLFSRHQDFEYAGGPSSSVSRPEPLLFGLSLELLQQVNISAKKFAEFSSNFELVVLEFEKFGKNTIVKWKLSPDAFCQMALQLAYYRLYGHLCATYESAATKKYLHGRTEVGRSASMPALEWVKAMEDPKVPVRLPS